MVSTSAGGVNPMRSLLRSMCCEPIVPPSVGGIRQRSKGPPGPLNVPRLIMSHGPEYARFGFSA